MRMKPKDVSTIKVSVCISGTLSRYIVKIVNLKENKRNFKTSISYMDCKHYN